MFYKTKKIRVACADKNMLRIYPVYSGRYTAEQLATDVAYASSLTKGDLTAVLSALSKIASSYIENGCPVSLGRLGTIRASIKARASETPEGATPEKIVRTRILFSPSNELRNLLKTMPLEKFNPGSCIIGNNAVNNGIATPLTDDTPEP